jgi:structural maintenance of chromosome 2
VCVCLADRMLSLLVDEITVTRIVESNKSKYLLNGKNATQSAIHDLFKSVSLNVNNPRFLILQGQVTKVSKSKPQEILGLIEEAAGTRMYDQKKAEALKTIAKKDDKLKEIRTTIDTDITPTINKLQQDEQNYKMYTELKKRYKLMNDQLIAHDYWQLMSAVRKTEIDVNTMKTQTDEFHRRNRTIADEIERIDDEVKNIEKERNESKRPMSNENVNVNVSFSLTDVGNEVSELQCVYEKKSIEVRTRINDNDRLAKQLSQHKQQLSDAEQQHKQLIGSIEQLENEIVASRKQYSTLSEQMLVETEYVKQLQRRYEAVSTGTAVVADGCPTVQLTGDSQLTNKERLDKYKEQRNEMATKIKQLQQRVRRRVGSLATRLERVSRSNIRQAN